MTATPTESLTWTRVMELTGYGHGDVEALVADWVGEPGYLTDDGRPTQATLDLLLRQRRDDQAEDLYDLLGGTHDNVWEDVIYGHPAYDEAGTSIVWRRRHGEGDMVATTSGAVFRHADETWVRAGVLDDYR